MADTIPHWYAIRTRLDFRAEEQLRCECEEVFFPKEEIKTTSGQRRVRAIIPHVLFIKTTRQHAIDLEQRSRRSDDRMVPFWIYRYVKGEEIQMIPDCQIRLLRLLTVDDTSRCEIFNKSDFRPGAYVRVTGGCYEGLTGYVQRVKKNKHVVVRIEGICMVILPFIHPDLLEPITNY